MRSETEYEERMEHYDQRLSEDRVVNAAAIALFQTGHYKIIPGFDGDGWVTDIELRPDAVCSPSGGRVSLLQIRQDIDDILVPPKGWHWFTDGLLSQWYHLRFAPSDEEILEEAIRILNDGADIMNAPDVWDAAAVKFALRYRTSYKKIIRFAELSFAYLRSEAARAA